MLCCKGLDPTETAVVKGKRGPKRKSSAPMLVEAKLARKSEVEVARDEIEAQDLGNYCAIL